RHWTGIAINGDSLSVCPRGSVIIFTHATSANGAMTSIKRVARRAVGGLARTAVGRRLLDAALADREVWARVVSLRCELVCAEATFDDQCPVDVSVIRGFEDVHWLYSA